LQVSPPIAVAVNLDPKTTALLVFDVTSVICPSRPACVASVPKMAALLKSARNAGAFVVYSDTATAGSVILPEIAPQPGEPKVTGYADKFLGTNLEKMLRDKGIQTVVVVGSPAHAILYTAFGAILRGFKVVVAEDSISVGDAESFGLTVALWLNFRQQASTNPVLDPDSPTLTRTDLIGFGTRPTGTVGRPAPLPVAPAMPAPSAVTLPKGKTAVLVLDLVDHLCFAQCVQSLPKIAAMLKQAREAKATIVYTVVPSDNVIPSEIAPRSGERVESGMADHFYGTDLDHFLTLNGITHLVIVGRAHGGVLYTSFGANARGYTVVVPEDAISEGPGDDFLTTLTKWQLLNQPGFANPGNGALVASRVTLSLTDLIAFEK